MPNHISTNLVVTGGDKEVKRFVETVIGEEKSPYGDEMIDVFDFNKIIPCHEDLHKAISPRRTKADLDRARTNKRSEADIKELMEQVELSNANMKKFGYANWYDFCCDKWGTKWGAYDCHINGESEGRLEMSYSTAWSPATPIFHKLAEMFPTLTFEVSFLDEGMGFGGTQVFAGKGFTETIYDGDALYNFANENFGGEYSQCECGEWFEANWLEEGSDLDKCEDCQPVEEEK